MTNDEKLMQQALDALLGMGQKAADAMNGDAFHECSIAVSRLRARLAQPEPEPVAWRFDQAKYRENDLRGRQWSFNVFSQTKPYMDEMVRNVTPLYTAPPQREWQGLTDEEEEQIIDAHWNEPDMFIEAIEAKLKEKNGA